MDVRAHPVVLSLLVLLGLLVPIPVVAQPALTGAWDGDEPDEMAHGRASTWLTLGGFARVAEGARPDVGGLAVLGVAFDRLAARDAGAARSTAMRGALLAASTAAWAGPPSSGPPPAAVAVAVAGRLPVTAAVARQAVVAAWRASGLGKDDAMLDAVLARARASAILPELRLRAARVLTDTDRLDDPTAPPGTSAALGWETERTSLWLEARATWRLDRLLYADEEVAAERLRVDRSEARARTAARVLTELSQWQRAWVDERGAPGGSPDASDAEIRMNEAEAALDVLTAGWFSAWMARTVIAAAPP